MTTVIIVAREDLEEPQGYLKDIKDRTGDFRYIFEKMRDDLSDQWKRNFTTNGSLVGGWRPLDKEYGAWKSVHFPGAPPMIRTGRLFRSVSDLRGAPNEINKMSATFGTDIKYADFHQYGTKNMAKREIVFEPFGFAQKWSRAAADYIMDGKVG